MEYISYNTGTRALPDIYALALGRCAPSGIVRIYQAKHSCLCYNYYIYRHTRDIRDDSNNTFLEITSEHLADGSYSARFTWKDNHPALPKNLSTCARRTRALAHKLAQTPHLLTKYNKILTKQEHCGFIERVHSPTDPMKCHYIPQHAIRKYSQTTLIRIVYDCSCHQSKDQPSLNDCLLTGDSQLNDICCIILRFRCHPVGICTDIEKAFLHVWLHEDDRLNQISVVD